eukprot:4104606-Amphidinium_carterae.1
MLCWRLDCLTENLMPDVSVLMLDELDVAGVAAVLLVVALLGLDAVGLEWLLVLVLTVELDVAG